MKKIILIILIICPLYLISQNCATGGRFLLGTDTQPCDPNPNVIVFEDDFNTWQLNSSKWTAVNGVVRDQNHVNERQWYTPNNIEVNNETLKLVVKKETLLNQCFSIWNGSAMQTLCQDFNYTSAEIDSKYKFGWGRYEIRCKIPKGYGFWPAFWTFGGSYLGQTYKNKIDVFEFWNESNNSLSQVVNTNVNFDFDQSGSPYYCSAKYTGPDYSTSFHIFAVQWTPFSIRWYVDNVCIRTINRYYQYINGRVFDCTTSVPCTVSMSKAFPSLVPSKIIANLAIECNNGDEPNSTTPFPSSFEIDYIRYYKPLPMSSDLTYSSIASVNLSDDFFNAIGGNTITLNNNFKLGDNKQLKVVARNTISLNNGFELGNNCDFEAVIDNR